MTDQLHSNTFGTGPDFIFQHGLSANTTQVSDLFKGFEGLKIHTIDCPGHGGSPLNENTTPSFDYYADEVIGYMDNHSLKKAVFGGISMGSGISLNIALRYPERVEALILVRPAWLDTGNPENLRILLKATDFIGQDNGRSLFMETAEYKTIEKDLPSAANSVLGLFDSQQRPELSKVLTSLTLDSPVNNLKELRKILVPCTIIVNHDDPLHPHELGAVLNSAIVGSNLYTVTSRYVDALKHRNEVQEIIYTFFKKL